VTFDIEYLRYRYTISNKKIIDIDEHSISKSSISNVTLDIERPILDIGVPRIQMVFRPGGGSSRCKNPRPDVPDGGRPGRAARPAAQPDYRDAIGDRDSGESDTVDTRISSGIIV
jgi:hypothetical protein